MSRIKTLRVRFALGVSLLLLVALVGMGVYLYFRMAHNLSSAVNSFLRLSSTQAMAAVEVSNGQINFDSSLPEGVEAANLVQHGLTIRIFNPSGMLIQALGPYGKSPVDPNTLAPSRNGRASFSTFVDPTAGDDIRAYTAPIIQNQRVVAIVQVAQDVGSIQDTLDSLLTTLLLVIPLIVAVAGVGGYFLAARALAPIDAITRMAHRISAEDLSKRIGLPATDDEVGRLATTFDEMLARLDRSFQRERQFTADASHELRTPITAMQTILSVIRQERRSPEEYERALDDMLEETDRLNTLTETLLDLARRDTHLAQAREQVDLSTLLRDVGESMRSLAEAKGLALLCNVPDGLSIMGNRDELIRLFVNLLDNAIEFTPAGRIILTAAWKGDAAVEVSITDTGIGIASEHLPRLFDRFYRVDRSRSRRGTGLGLAIAQEIAREHSGEITVHSEVGKGTSFVIRLGRQRGPKSGD